MRIGLRSSLKEEEGPEKTARERDMSRVQKPVVCQLIHTSIALIFAETFVLRCSWV